MPSPATTTPSTAEHLALIHAMSERLADLMATLWARWQDEWDYEDIADYAIPIRKVLPAGVTLEYMTKTPFGFVFSVGTAATYEITITARTYAWQRLT